MLEQGHANILSAFYSLTDISKSCSVIMLFRKEFDV
jgi:hypothetical protein